MKAIIKSASKISGVLTQDVVYDILLDDDTILVEGMTLTCMPSEVGLTIKNSLANFQAEYEVSLLVTEGLEIS